MDHLNHRWQQVCDQQITTNLEEILEDFEVFGLSDETWQEFEKGKEHEAFLVKRKSY